MLKNETFTYNIIGACFQVYKTMGCGFLETVYHECLGIELSHRNIPFTSQPRLSLSYRDRPLKQQYIPDFIIYDQIILELKALSHLADEHQAQLLNYLNAAGLNVGLLINFGHHPKLEYKRMVL